MYLELYSVLQFQIKEKYIHLKAFFHASIYLDGKKNLNLQGKSFYCNSKSSLETFQTNRILTLHTEIKVTLH